MRATYACLDTRFVHKYLPKLQTSTLPLSTRGTSERTSSTWICLLAHLSSIVAPSNTKSYPTTWSETWDENMSHPTMPWGSYSWASINVISYQLRLLAVPEELLFLATCSLSVAETNLVSKIPSDIPTSCPNDLYDYPCMMPSITTASKVAPSKYRSTYPSQNKTITKTSQDNAIKKENHLIAISIDFPTWYQSYGHGQWQFEDHL